MRSVRLALLIAAPFMSAAAQQVPLRDLPKPSREIEDPFSMIAYIAEVRPGQIAVADGIDAEVTMVDFAKGTRTVLGRKGAGPGEYTLPVAVLRLPGDTLLVFDGGGGGGGSARLVRFNPDLKPGATNVMMLFNTRDTTVVQGTIFPDARGNLYSLSVRLKVGPSGPMPSDTMKIVRFEPRNDATFTTLATIRTPQAGPPQREQTPTSLKVKSPFPGLVNSDAWTAFPDGRIAIIRGTNYTVEFIAPDGKKTPPVAIPYERIKLTEADKEAELAASRKQLALVSAMIKKSLPPNFAFDIEIIPPPSWPAEYPPIAAIVAWPAPNGNVWVRRSVPARLDREQWDVISPAGKLVARWQLPPKTTLNAVGADAVYTVRTDEDDLRYVQRIAIPK